MLRRYSNSQVNKAVKLVKTKGYSRKKAAKETKINRHTLAYHLNKKFGQTQKDFQLTRKIKKVQTILTKATDALKTLY